MAESRHSHSHPIDKFLCSTLFQQEHLDPTPAFGVETSFGLDPNSGKNYPSYNARTTIYYPIEPPAIKDARARVNAIKATKMYQQLEMDEHLIKEFEKVNLENKLYLKALIKSEKAKLHRLPADTSPANTEEEVPTRGHAEPESTANVSAGSADHWLDFITESPKEEVGLRPSSPKKSQYDFISNPPQKSKLREFIPQPERDGFTPKFGVAAQSSRQATCEDIGKESSRSASNRQEDVGEESSRSALTKFHESFGNSIHPVLRRPKTPWPDKGKGKARIPSFSSESDQDCPNVQSPSFKDLKPDVEDTDSSTLVGSNSASEASNRFSGLPNLLIPAHPCQKQKSAYSAFPPLDKETSTPPDYSIIHAPSPLRPRKIRASHRLRPLRPKSARRNLYWPASQSPSGRCHPVPFPPLHIPEPYVAWPSIPGQFKHRGPHAEDAELGPRAADEEPPKGRPRSNAISTPGVAAPLPGDRLKRKWSFVRGRKDQVQFRAD